MKDENIIDFQKVLDSNRIKHGLNEATDEEFDLIVREMLKNDFKPRLSFSERLFMFTAIATMIGGISLLLVAAVLSVY